MRSSTSPALLLGTLAALAMGCGGDPVVSHYLVAVDASPLSQLDPACYRGGTLPPERPGGNVFQALRWTLWEADGGRAYLELAAPPGGWVLGDAPAIEAPGAIAGTGEAFESERLDLGPANEPVRSRRVRVEFSERGELARGTLELTSNDVALNVRCTATLAFTARAAPGED